jgi:hypothetical protein
MLFKQLGPELNCSVVDAVRTGALISMAVSARPVTANGLVRVLIPSSNFPKVKNVSEGCKRRGAKAPLFFCLLIAKAPFVRVQ